MNHLGDANKISETPRTDAVWELFATDITLEPDVEFSQLARQLKRELTTANDRIKRLEEGGDRAILNSYLPDRIAMWTKAKEAKL